MNPADFFRFARERHCIYLRRQDGVSRDQWTQDPVLREYRFTNVYRELDATTVWFKENVRERLRHTPEVLLATVLFRWLNRISAGEAIFQQKLLGDETAWDVLMRRGPGGLDDVAQAVRSYCGKGPYVTGSYIIKTPDGMDKLQGVLWCVKEFMISTKQFGSGGGDVFVGNAGWQSVSRICMHGGTQIPLEQVWKWLCCYPFLGGFMAYEVVTDLRHTTLLDRAPDIMTWANAGPGAKRGLNRILGRSLNYNQNEYLWTIEMRELLELSTVRSYWPNSTDFPPLEMRDIEHTLCEFDKYERTRLGEGRPRQRYK